MSRNVDYETLKEDGFHLKKGRDSLRAHNISTFAADGTPLPTIDTSETAMKKNKGWIAALLAFGSDEKENKKKS